MSYRPTEKTEARKKAQHNLLLSSALALVSEGGFQNLTVASVAEKADVAIGTVYKYFESKAALCIEVFHRNTEKEIHQMLEVTCPESSESTCRQRLLDAIARFSDRAFAKHRLAYALIAEPVDSIIEHERLRYRQSFAEIFELLITEGITNGEFCRQDVKVTASALVGALAETLVGSIGSHTPESLGLDQAKLVKNLQDFCLRAVV